jgi:hypothetical protein
MNLELKRAQREQTIMEPILCIGWDVGGWMGHKQGVAVAEWSPGSVLGKPTSFRLPFDRLLTLPEMLEISGVDAGRLEQQRTVIAADAPLGFPASFSALVSAWPDREGNSNPAVTRPGREIDNAHAYRATDRHIYHHFSQGSKGRKKPLSASFDRLGNNATVALEHARFWRQCHGIAVLPFDTPSAGQTIMFEAYPALVKARLNNKEAELDPRFARNFPKPRAELTSGSDAHDALICSLFAVCQAADGLGGIPNLVGPPQGHAAPHYEGWIYYPRLD